MKKTPGIICLLLFSSSLFSQQKFEFSLGLRPEHQYDQFAIQKITLTIKLDSGSKEVVERMEQGGFKNPTIQQINTKIQSNIVTGVLTGSKKEFPVRMTLTNMTTDNGASIPPGTVLFGKASLDRLATYDSVGGNQVPEATKRQLIQVINSISNQVVFPVKTLGTGDTMVIITPLHMPMGGNSLDMAMTSIYRVSTFTDSTADFDVDMDIGMDMNIAGASMPLKGSGTGTGKLTYSRQSHYFNLLNMKYHIDLYLKQEGLAMHFIIESDADQHCRVKKI